ncbi:MAG: TIGR04282 family arsenosugar biosynthesis glycosyltransferase [Bacteroidia bacterium]
MKYPALGKVKTRLASSIGNNITLEIYKYLVNNTIKATSGFNTELHFYGDLPKDHNYKGYVCKKQIGDNIGVRMHNSLKSMLKSTESVILIGSDIPNISSEVIQSAAIKLNQNDLVFGPAKDGGFYLVGLKKANQKLFDLKSWSHKNVLKHTLDNAKELGLNYTLVNELSDLDTAQDLDHFTELKHRFL